MYNARLGARRRTDGGSARVARLGGWAGRRIKLDGGGEGLGGWRWTAVGTPGSDGWSRFAHFGTSRNHPSWKCQCGHFLFKKWLGAENTRRAAPPKMQRLRMQKNTRPDAISRPQSPQSVVNSCQNPSLKMKKKARKKLIKNNFIL